MKVWCASRPTILLPCKVVGVGEVKMFLFQQVFYHRRLFEVKFSLVLGEVDFGGGEWDQAGSDDPPDGVVF